MRAQRTSGKLRTEKLAGLSFCTLHRDGSGMIVESDHFDVPDEAFDEGYVTGLAAAGELLASFRDSRRAVDPLHVSLMLEAAGCAAAQQPTAGRNVPSRAGAALGFLEAMAEAVCFAGRHSNHEQWTAAMVSRRRDHVAQLREIERRQRETFPARMKAAREAKRAAAVA